MTRAVCSRPPLIDTTPMLIPTTKDLSCQAKRNWATLWRSDSAIVMARSIGQPQSSTPNSSPPRRASVSESRMPFCSRPVTWRSSSSPATWPQVSLTTLNWSRSR